MRTAATAVAIVLAAILGGCAERSEMAVVPELTMSASPTPSTPPKDAESEDSTPQPCSSEIELAIRSTIESQTQAFANDDFELAYSFASPSFQASVGLERFVQIINGSYGPLISSSDLVFSDCHSDLGEQFGVISVRFIQANNDVFGLQYLMLNSDLGWRVEGASNLAVVGEGS